MFAMISISCGDAWMDPNISKSEHQRRYLIANMSSDVRTIEEYLTLRKPKGLPRVQLEQMVVANRPW